MRNVALVASGAAGAQTISMVWAPVITRLYGPEAFGVLGTFMAIVAVMAPLAALSYPIAIVLPKQDEDAIGIARLSLLIAIVTASLTALALLGFRDPILQLLNLEAISSLIFIIPAAMFFSACVAVVSQWVIRKKLFKVKAKVAVAQAFLVNCGKAGIGLFSPTAVVLVLIAAFGSALHALMLGVGVRCQRQRLQRRAARPSPPVLALAKRHLDFPLYRTPQIFINAASQGLPVMMLASFFGPAAAGFYTLSRMVMELPSTLIAQSVGEVFYPHITEASYRGENRHQLIWKVTLGLAVVGIIPFATVFAFGPWLFGFVFGSEWTVAGEYARWLSLMLFFNFINRPSVAAVPVLGLQRGLVIYEVFSTGTKILALYLGFVVFGSDVVAVALFGLFGAAAYIALIAWVTVAARNIDSGTEYAPKASR